MRSAQSRHTGYAGYPLGYVCFDLETTGLFDAGRAPAVLCAATVELTVLNRTRGSLECNPPRVWHDKTYNVMNTANRDVLDALIEYLIERRDSGYLPITWNGSGFDFKVLHALLQDRGAQIIDLCKTYTDVCFNVFVHKGFPIKLASVATAFGCENKSDCGANAPTLWSSGLETDKIRVINYCQQDVVVLASVVSCIMAFKGVKWMTKSGNKSQFMQHFDLLWPLRISCRERVADNSWMRAGQKRSINDVNRPKLDKTNFVGWLK